MIINENQLLSRIKGIMGQVPQIFLDYDGTLVPIINDPEFNQADKSLIELLASLNTAYETYIVTGRDICEIMRFIGEYNIIGLHGATFRIQGENLAVPGFKKYEQLSGKLYSENSYLVNEFPGLRIYRKSGGLLFHTGNIKNPGKITELRKIIIGLSREFNMNLYTGIDILELRMPRVDKGNAIKLLRNKNRQAIIMGDDATDEDAFKLNPDAITIKVGDQDTYAKYSIDYSSVRPFLLKLLDL